MIEYSTWKNYLLTSSPLCTLVSKQIFKVEYQSLVKYLKRNYTDFSGNNIAKFIEYQILTDTLITKLKWDENLSVILPINILLIVMESPTFVWYLVRTPIWIRPV